MEKRVGYRRGEERRGEERRGEERRGKVKMRDIERFISIERHVYFRMWR